MCQIKGEIMAIKDIKGQSFGRLTAIKRVGKDKGGRSLWLFRCECGNEKVIEAHNVTSGKTISCGCFHKERISEICSKDLEAYSKAITYL